MHKLGKIIKQNVNFMRKLTFLLTCLFLVSLGLVNAQTKAISGKVLSAEDGQPIVGATVKVKGVTQGTVTGIDGDFRINVQINSTLVISYIGMKSVEVKANDNLTVKLEADSKQIDEIVVTALGIKKEKKALGYSVQSIGNDELSKTSESNVINSLAGKAAGVQVISSGGVPGASTKILIRGNSSFTGNNQPLIVVDGIPIDNSTNATVAGDYPYNSNLEGVNNTNRALDLNPNDIESVSILKGPSAAALYGARAANGAIVYTTKKGNAGGPKVVYSFSADFDQVSQLPEEQKLYAQGSIVGGVATYQPGSTANSWGPLITSISGAKVYNNTDNFFRTGVGFTHNLSFVGATDKSSYRVSLSRFDQNGIIPNSNLRRTTARVSSDMKITDKLSSSVNFSYSTTNSTKVQNGSNLSGMMLSLMRAPVTWDLSDWKNEDGSSKNFYSAYDNPYWSAYNNPFKDYNDRFLGNALFKYDVLPWLKASYKLGLDVYTNKTKQIFAIGSTSVDDYMGKIEEQTLRYKDYYQDVLLSAQKTFAEKFDVSLNFGGNLNHEESESLYGRGTQLNIPDFYNIGNASVLYADESSSIIRTGALFFDAGVSWKSLLFINVTGRDEWSSTFGKNKSFFYPSVSGSFVFSDLLPKNNVVSYGKLRVARASAGNSPSVYSSRTYYTKPYFADGFTDGNSFPFLGQNGFTYSNVLGNANLKPEKSTESEAGLDMKFFTNRLGFEFTFYNKETSDILVSRPIAGSSGFQATISNSGKMRNRGIELLLNAVPVKNRNLTWSIDLNFTKNTNKVLALADGVGEIDIESAFQSITSEAIVGKPYGALYATKWERDDKGNLIIGSNGLPKVADERGYIGNPFPDWTGGIRNTLTYKGLTLTALLDIRQGGKIWNGTIARMNRLGRTKASADRERTYVISGVKENGSTNDIAISANNYFVNYVGDGSLSATENAIYDGSWLRLRELSLSYHLALKSRWLKSIDLTLIGRNLWLKTDYPGVDPETSLTGAGSNLTGFDYFNNPGTKTYSVGVKFSLF